MIPDPSFDEQSARALVFALLDQAGEVAGILADTEEVTKADGDIGYCAIVRIHGRVTFRSKPIWATPHTEDATLARRLALDRARSQAVDEVVTLGQRGDGWAEALRRFRREPTDAHANPIMPTPERVGPTPSGATDGGGP